MKKEVHNFKKDLELDAQLVFAAMHGMFVPCAIKLGLKADEAWHRSQWLKHQGKYVDQVADRVVELEKERGMEGS